jgi:hypothetical protein
MNTQQYYETVREYFSQPDAEFGMDKSGNCVLWDPTSNAKCAVGCAIPNYYYKPELEGFNISTLQEELPSLFGEVQGGFLRKAQSAHDKWAMRLYEPGLQPDQDRQYMMSRFINELDTLARDYGLKVGTLEHD